MGVFNVCEDRFIEGRNRNIAKLKISLRVISFHPEFYKQRLRYRKKYL